MLVSDLDAMIAAQRAYEAARSRAYYGSDEPPETVCQFVTRKQLGEISAATGVESRRMGNDAFSTLQLVYNGCLFQAPSGRAD